jgi:ankyrin repeat protein
MLIEELAEYSDYHSMVAHGDAGGVARAVLTGFWVDTPAPLQLDEAGRRIVGPCMTGLMNACQKGDSGMARALLTWGANPNKYSFSIGEYPRCQWAWRKTPLMFAAENMDAVLVELLGDYGARFGRAWSGTAFSYPPDDLDRVLDSIQHNSLAPSPTRPEMSEHETAVLCDRLADLARSVPTSLDQSYFRVELSRAAELSSAVGKGALDRVKALCNRERYREVINIKSCLAKPIFANWPVPMTPLMEASSRGFAQLAEILLDSGANPDLFVDDGFTDETALMLAARAGHTRIVDALLSAGAAVDMQAYHGHTALMIAAQAGHPLIVDRLLEQGANIRLRMKRTSHWNSRRIMPTAIDLARSAQQERCVEILEAAEIASAGQ